MLTWDFWTKRKCSYSLAIRIIHTSCPVALKRELAFTSPIYYSHLCSDVPSTPNTHRVESSATPLTRPPSSTSPLILCRHSDWMYLVTFSKAKEAYILIRHHRDPTGTWLPGNGLFLGKVLASIYIHLARKIHMALGWGAGRGLRMWSSGRQCAWGERRSYRRVGQRSVLPCDVA